MKVLLVAVNAKYIHSSLGTRYLKTYCQSLPCQIEIAEYTINNHLLPIADDILGHAPDFIGIECYIWNIELIKKLLPLLKKLLPHAKICCGGPEVSYDVENFMQEFPCVDYLVRGEGEDVFFSLLEDLCANKIPQNPALAQRNFDGSINIGYPSSVPSLDRLPFPYSEADLAELKGRIIYYESSRGCPFSCKYCLSCATRGVRYRSLDKVFSELQFFASHNVRQVKFVDRTFNADKKHFIPIIEFLAKLDCKTNFHFEMAIDILDDEGFAALKKLPKGRVQLEIGIQSTNERTLSEVSRKNNWSKIAANIRRIIALGTIHVHTDLIIGLPQENMQSLHNSFNDAYALKPQMLQVGFLKFLKGSAMEDLVEPYRYQYMDSAPYEVLASNDLSAKELRFLRLFVEVFELYGNSGRFACLLEYLHQKAGNDYFSLFSKLASFWLKEGLYKKKHAPQELYTLICNFARQEFKLNEDTFLKQACRFDLLASENGKFRNKSASVLADKDLAAFWKKGGGAEKYAHDYKFSSWRDAKRDFALEIFSFDMLQFLNSGKIEEKKTVLLFDYRGETAKITAIPINEIIKED